MAQSDVSRRRSWTAGAGTLATSSSSQWVRNERYAELKQLEQEAKKSMKEMKLLEIDIREKAAALEKLKKLDGQRVAKLLELTRGIDEKNREEGNGGERNQENEDLEQQLEQMKQEHAGIRRRIEDIQIGLELKRGELDHIAGHHRSLCEQISEEEKALQAAELEESFQQSVAVQHEMRSLSEDLRRLGHLMDDLSPTTSLPHHLKQNSKSQSPRTFRRDVSRGGRTATRTLREGVSSSGLPSSSRSKEPVEFEVRETLNRKRPKNSSYEEELERLHQQREMLEAEAHQKQMLLESVTRLSSQSRDSKLGSVTSSRKGSPSPQQMLSPSSVFEGFSDSPSLGQAAPASAESSSASSEDMKVEEPEEGAGSSVSMPVHFGPSSSLEIYGQTTLPAVGTGASRISGEEGSELLDDLNTDHLDSVASGSCSVDSWSDNVGEYSVMRAVGDVKEQALLMEQGLKEEVSAGEYSFVKALQDPKEQALTIEHGQEDECLPEMGETDFSGDYSVVGAADDVEAEAMMMDDGLKEEILAGTGETEDFSGVYSVVGAIEDVKDQALILEEESQARKVETGGSLEEYSVVRAVEDAQEQVPMMEHGLEECPEGSGETEGSPGQYPVVKAVEEEGLAGVSSVSEITKLEEETGGSWEEGEILAEISPHGPEAINFETVSEEESLGTSQQRNGDFVEFILELKKVEDGEEASASGLRAVDTSSELNHASTQSCKQGSADRRDASEAAEISASNHHLDQNQAWTSHAETQIQKFSSQLSLLDQKVGTETKLQSGMKKQEYSERSSAATKQLSEQIRCFEKEIYELRENMSHLKQNLLSEVESRSIAEHTVQQFQTVCVDQSAKLEQLESQVSRLATEIKAELKLRAELEGKLEKEVQERLKVETELKDLSQAVTLTAATKGKTEEALHELVERQKNLLVSQLKEAEKLRSVAEVRVVTLDKQAEQLGMVCDVAQNVQEVFRFQDKILKLGLQTLFQLLMLVICVSSLYSRISEATKHALIPT
ncbi:hypothetical protein R1sor_022266 [Riccia sorocarpa]|uniref:Uncharacterized protein n=1 Tax=Riccia sorocarpa TaxID=122646 RepID=A0ABD3GMJ2_9MARC